jgi:hypothetical protein
VNPGEKIAKRSQERRDKVKETLLKEDLTEESDEEENVQQTPFNPFKRSAGKFFLLSI